MGIKENIEKKISKLVEKSSGSIGPILLKTHSEKKQILVFYFHSLYKDENEKKLNHIDPQKNLTRDQFVEFIEYFLRCNYTFISPAELAKGLPPDRPYIMITFDDGYFNNLIAIEVLTKYQIPGTFFISAKNLVSNESYWWDIIYKYRMKEGLSAEKISKEQVSLKSLKHADIENYIRANFGKSGFSPWSDIDRPLSPAELKSISTNPYVFLGNHTYHHAILTNYDISDIKMEMSLCDNFLRDTVGTKPDIISFPNGNYNEEVLAVSQELGFRYAFTVEHGMNYLPLADEGLIRLKRFLPQSANFKKYAVINRLGSTPQTLFADLKNRFSGFLPHRKNVII